MPYESQIKKKVVCLIGQKWFPLCTTFCFYRHYIVYAVVVYAIQLVLLTPFGTTDCCADPTAAAAAGISVFDNVFPRDHYWYSRSRCQVGTTFVDDAVLTVLTTMGVCFLLHVRVH